MKRQCCLPAEPSSVPAARRFVADALAGLPEDAIDEIVLMVSELSTNCVIHAGTEFDIALTRTGRVVRIEVTDGSDGLPAVESPAPDEPHGRGMQIVDQLATAWGVSAPRGSGLQHPPPRGKTLWFSLLVPALISRVGPRCAERDPAADAH